MSINICNNVSLNKFLLNVINFKKNKKPKAVIYFVLHAKATAIIRYWIVCQTEAYAKLQHQAVVCRQSMKYYRNKSTQRVHTSTKV